MADANADGQTDSSTRNRRLPIPEGFSFSKFLSGLLSAFFLFTLVQNWWSNTSIEGRRDDALAAFERDRGSRVIGMIHRQDSFSLIGIPIASYISIEDSEAILRLIRQTPDDTPIDLILHTPGGLVLASEQIAAALADHPAKVTVIVPHYAMSGGTLVALAADEIILDDHAVLGPVDPQLGQYPAASLVKVTEIKTTDKIADETLIMADIARKAQRQVTQFVTKLLQPRLSPDRALEVATILSGGRFTHDFPIMTEMARDLDLPISTEMPNQIYDLMDLYPQATNGRPSIVYVERRADSDDQ